MMISGNQNNINLNNTVTGRSLPGKIQEKDNSQKDTVTIQGESSRENDIIMPPDLRKININKTLVDFANSLEADKVQDSQGKEWTVMFYMDGANDLEPHMAKAMLDLEKVGSSDKINLVSQIARLSQDELLKITAEKYKNDPKALEEAKNHKTGIDGDWRGVRRYYITGNKDNEGSSYSSKMVENLYLTDISHPQTLSDFVTWGMKSYPAKHYMLVLMDHGAGWPGALSNDFSGSDGQMMSTPSIEAALKSAEARSHKKLDIIHFDTCLMGSAEVAYQLKDSADYMIASEEVATSAALNYGSIIEKMDKIVRNTETTPKDISRLIVNHFTKDNPDAFKTHAAIDLKEMEKVKTAMDEVIEALNKTDTPMHILKDVVKSVQSYGRMAPYHPFTDYRDLKDLCVTIQNDERIKDENLKKTVKKLILTLNQAVVALKPPATYVKEEVEKVEKSGRVTKTHVVVTEEEIGGGGLSIYLPLQESDTYKKFQEYYSQLDMSQKSQWDEFLGKITSSPDQDTDKSAKAPEKYKVTLIPDREAGNSSAILT
ncbi:MAG: clostripain-related cysteine peptidase [Candidatus Eremiobacterota bacterium]